MTGSPTPAERAALGVALAVTYGATPDYDLRREVVFALGAAQLLQSPETAAELEQARAQLTQAGDMGAQAYQRAGENGALANGLRLENERLLKRVAELEADSARLNALYAAGVDNWEGYGGAVEAGGAS